MNTGDSWWKRGGPPTAVVLLLLLVWQIGVQLSGIKSFELPSPLDIVREAVVSFPRVWFYAKGTLYVTLIGFIAGVSAGILLALAMHLGKLVKSALYPLLIISQNVHPAAVGPLLMIWFGFLSPTPKVIVVALYCFFPVAVGLTDGLLQTDRSMMDYMRMIGASKWQLFRKLELPHALPSLFSGLKIAATYSVMGAVIADFLGGNQGLGYYIQLSRNQFSTSRVFVALVVIIALALLMVGFIAMLERLLLRAGRRGSQ